MTGAAVLSLAAVTYGNLVNLVPQRLHDRLYVPLNLVVGACVGAVGYWWLRLDGESLGLARESVAPGLQWGAATGFALAAPLFLALAVPSLRRRLADARVQGLATGGLAYRALVRIPLGTALFEEWVFRGVLYAAWLGTGGPTAAFLGSSVAFGLWHVLPTLKMVRANRPDMRLAFFRLSVIGGVLATVAGGLLFGALRYWTGGILAPVLAHALVNSLALVAAYAAWHHQTRP